jgi:hypothetical protein
MRVCALCLSSSALTHTSNVHTQTHTHTHTHTHTLSLSLSLSLCVSHPHFHITFWGKGLIMFLRFHWMLAKLFKEYSAFSRSSHTHAHTHIHTPPARHLRCRFIRRLTTKPQPAGRLADNSRSSSARRQAPAPVSLAERQTRTTTHMLRHVSVTYKPPLRDRRAQQHTRSDTCLSHTNHRRQTQTD